MFDVMEKSRTRVRAEVVDWIQYIVKRKGWSPTELARKSRVAPSTVLRILHDEDHRFNPSLTTLRKLSEGSGYPIPKRIFNASGVSDISDEEEMKFTGARQVVTELPIEEKPARKARAAAKVDDAFIELRFVSSLPESLHPIVNEMGVIPRPDRLKGDPTAFAFNMTDAALEPWIKAGSVMFATKLQDPKVGDKVMYTRQDNRTFVRLLKEIDESGLMVAGSNGDDQVVPFEDIKDIAVVLIVDHV